MEGQERGPQRTGLGRHTPHSPQRHKGRQRDLPPVEGGGAGVSEGREQAREGGGGAPRIAGAEGGEVEAQGDDGDVGEGAGEVVEALALGEDGGDGEGGLDGEGGADGGDGSAEERGGEVGEVEEPLHKRHVCYCCRCFRRRCGVGGWRRGWMGRLAARIDVVDVACDKCCVVKLSYTLGGFSKHW